jgi:hypothetical protein
MPGLSVSDLVNVSVVLSPLAPATQNFGALLVLGSSAVIDVSQRFRIYSTLTQVANDFGTSAPEYLAGDLFFSQSPQPTTLLIGRWAQTATSGLLHCAILNPTQQSLSNFTSVTNGGVDFTIDGAAVNLTGLNFSSITNLNGVASIINTALGVHGSCVWNSVYSRFEITSASSGTSSSVSFGSTGAGTDISTLIGSTNASGATAVAGIAAETVESAVNTLINLSNAWYGLAIATNTMPADSDILNVAGIIEAANPHRFFVATTQETGALSSTSTSDLAYLLQQLGYNHTACQYSSSSPYAGVSLFARQATVNYAGSNTVINLMFQQEPGVVPETLSESQAAALKAKNCNVFVNYNNSTAIIQWGTCVSGQYIDVIVGCDYLSNAIQTAIYALLYTGQKIAQTDAGVNLIVTTAENVLVGAVTDGLLAPGVWNGPAIGPIASGQTLAKGYFVYAPPIASQTQSARAARQSPVLQVLVKMAGAIDTVACIITVSQ